MPCSAFSSAVLAGDVLLCEISAAGLSLAVSVNSDDFIQGAGWVGRLAGFEVGEFGGHRLAENNRAGLSKQGNAGRVPGWAATPIDRRAQSGRHTLRIDYVLDANWYTMERAARRFGVPFFGLHHSELRIYVLPRTYFTLAGFHPRQTGFNQSRRTRPSDSDRLGGLTGCQFMKWFHR